MKKENDELFDLFRTRLEHAEVDLRDNFWEQLESEIPVVIRNKRRLFIQRFSAAASVLLVLAGVSAAFWHFSPKDEIADAFTKVEISTAARGNTKNDIIKQDLPSIHTSQAKPARPRAIPQTRSSEIEEEEESFSFSFSMSISVNEQSTGNKNEQHQGNRLAGGINSGNTYLQDEPKETVMPVTSKSDKKRPWSLGLFASGNVLKGSESRSGLQMLSGRDNSLNISNAPGTVSRADFSSQEDFDNYMLIAGNTPVESQRTSLNHKLPLSMGLTVRKDLTERFSLETGLIYTQLQSELTGGTDKTFYKQDQKLHYLGIPIKANYTLYEDKHFDLYASAGGMVEKSVSGNIKTDYYDAGKHTHSSKNSLSVDPLQMSLTAGLGVQYKFNDRISVYAEPGLSYYFDDGSPVSTIRKEKPLNLNLLCGVRMTY